MPHFNFFLILIIFSIVAVLSFKKVVIYFINETFSKMDNCKNYYNYYRYTGSMKKTNNFTMCVIVTGNGQEFDIDIEAKSLNDLYNKFIYEYKILEVGNMIHMQNFNKAMKLIYLTTDTHIHSAVFEKDNFKLHIFFTKNYKLHGLEKEK